MIENVAVPLEIVAETGVHPDGPNSTIESSVAMWLLPIVTVAAKLVSCLPFSTKVRSTAKSTLWPGSCAPVCSYTDSWLPAGGVDVRVTLKVKLPMRPWQGLLPKVQVKAMCPTPGGGGGGAYPVPAARAGEASPSPRPTARLRGDKRYPRDSDA